MNTGPSGALPLGAKCSHLSSFRELRLVDGTCRATMVRLGAKTTIQTSVDPMGDPQADSKTTSKCAEMAPQGSQDDAMMSQGVPESETEDEKM